MAATVILRDLRLEGGNKSKKRVPDFNGQALYLPQRRGAVLPYPRR